MPQDRDRPAPMAALDIPQSIPSHDGFGFPPMPKPTEKRFHHVLLTTFDRSHETPPHLLENHPHPMSNIHLTIVRCQMGSPSDRMPSKWLDGRGCCLLGDSDSCASEMGIPNRSLRRGLDLITSTINASKESNRPTSPLTRWSVLLVRFASQYQDS